MVGRGWILALVCAASCTKSNPGATCSDGSCTDPAFPYCDSDGSVDGTPGECIAVSCAPGTILTCKGSQAFTCTATGDGYELDDCTLGCVDGPAPHCKYLQPTYMPDVCDTPAQQASISFAGSGTFDPNLDSNCTGGIATQSGGADLCVVRYGTIEIPASSTLMVLGGSGSARAIAFVADEGLTVDGFIDVGAHTGINGPGGGTFTSGALPSGGAGVIFGGGGAGGSGSGGPGGQHNGSNDAGGLDGGAMNGGVPTMNPGSLAVFVGGASSPVPGADNPPNATVTSIGGGGGALELVSCHGAVTISGMVNAGGGGGGAGLMDLVPTGGFGGGAGGNVVIEGPSVIVTGSVFANGGGGGGGAYVESGMSFAGVNGDDASLSDTTPAGGGASQGGSGGTGGYVGASAGPGMFSNGNGSGVYAPGGGGGSVGFLQTYTPTGVTPTLTPAHASPAFQPNGTVQTR